jgi:hypothetical protein
MNTIQTANPYLEVKGSESVAAYEYEKWIHWPVNWSAIWVGTLASIAMVVLCGLIGVAVGAHVVSPDHRLVDLKKVAMSTLAFSVFSAFLAFVVGGWVTGRIAGISRSEPAMLHGAIEWLVSVPILIVLASLGAGSYLGGWYAGLAGTPQWASHNAPPFERPERIDTGASSAERTGYSDQLREYENQVTMWKEESPKVVRNSALGAVTALLLGLVGSVLGGWMASGEPMTFTHAHHRARTSGA